MAWSFRKRKKVAPGVYLNFSKKGIGLSLGKKGARISVGPSGTYLNTSIPGTGLYNRQKIGKEPQSCSTISSLQNEQSTPQNARKKNKGKVLLWILLILNLLAFLGGIINITENKESLSSEDLFLTIFCAIVSIACIFGLIRINKKDPYKLGKKMGQEIVNQVLKADFDNNEKE